MREPESLASPVVAVLARSESFHGEWAPMAESLGARLRLASTAAALAPADASAIVVCVAGMEHEGADLLSELRTSGSTPDIAVVGAAADHRLASQLLRAGAADYFVLPSDLEALRGWLAERVERTAAAQRAAALAARERETYDFSHLIGHSPQLRKALDRAARVIPHATATVLLTGETGTGKELVARAIHYNGPRARSPFVEINCTALPATLLEAELFGYEKGAFTDARAAKPGLFEAAAGGTLFLDEIGDIPLELQAKLLKVLEEKKVRRLGSLRTTTVDLRIIAATHVDLAAAVRDGRFRQDLYYRLNVVGIHLPPLRDRTDDILLLAGHFLDRFSQEYGTERLAITTDLRSAFMRHSWPGNIRELRNAVERAVLLSGPTLTAADLFPESAVTAPGTDSPLPFPASMDDIEKAAAREMVKRLSGNKSAAAEALGISRSRLYRLLDQEEEV